MLALRRPLLALGLGVLGLGGACRHSRSADPSTPPGGSSSTIEPSPEELRPSDRSREEGSAPVFGVELLPWPPPAPTSLPASAITTSRLRSGDIADDFTNLEDLGWLGPIARDSAVVLLGENHYFRGIHHLAHRILFALNTHDHYGLVTLELGYWVGPFLDHYVTLPANQASRYREQTLRHLAFTEELLVFLEHVRRWNQARPDRPIAIASHDVNHDWQRALRHAVVPFFATHDPDLRVDLRGLKLDELKALVADLEARLPRAERHVHPDLPFLDHDHVRATLANFRPLWLEPEVGRDNFFIFRQEAIVHNLTDDDRLGPYFRRGKVMLWGGGYHTPTRLALPAAAHFLREGLYLEHQFPPTRGRAHSIVALGRAYTFADVASRSLERCEHTGLRHIIESFQRGLEHGALTADGAYVLGPDGLLDFVIANAAPSETQTDPIRLDRVDWDVLRRRADNDALRQQIEQARLLLVTHDTGLLVPKSPIVQPRCAADGD